MGQHLYSNPCLHRAEDVEGTQPLASTNHWSIMSPVKKQLVRGNSNWPAAYRGFPWRPFTYGSPSYHEVQKQRVTCSLGILQQLDDTVWPIMPDTYCSKGSVYKMASYLLQWNNLIPFWHHVRMLQLLLWLGLWSVGTLSNTKTPH